MCKVIKSLTEIKYERRSARVAPTLQVGGGGRGGAAKIGEPGRSCPTVSGTGDAPGWGGACQAGHDEGSSDDEKCAHIVNSTMLYLSPKDVDIRSTCPAFPAEDDGLLLMSPLSPCDNHHHRHCRQVF